MTEGERKLSEREREARVEERFERLQAWLDTPNPRRAADRNFPTEFETGSLLWFLASAVEATAPSFEYEAKVAVSILADRRALETRLEEAERRAESLQVQLDDPDLVWRPDLTATNASLRKRVEELEAEGAIRAAEYERLRDDFDRLLAKNARLVEAAKLSDCGDPTCERCGPFQRALLSPQEPGTPEEVA